MHIRVKIITLCFTPDGLNLLSAGSDKRLRLWDAFTGVNTMINYGHTRNPRSSGWTMKVIQPGDSLSSRILYPLGSSGDINIYNVRGGGKQYGTNPMKTLHGHFDAVNCFAYSERTQQIVSGGNDSMIIVWDNSQQMKESLKHMLDFGIGNDDKQNGIDDDFDNWSDDSYDAIDDNYHETTIEDLLTATSGIGNSKNDNSNNNNSIFVPPIMR